MGTITKTLNNKKHKMINTAILKASFFCSNNLIIVYYLLFNIIIYLQQGVTAIINSKHDILKVYGSCKEAALGLNTNAAQISKCCLDNEYADIPYHRVKGYLLLHYQSRHLNKSSHDTV